MLTFAVNGGTQRPLGGPGFTVPGMTGRMTNQRGFIGRMPFTMASEMVMVNANAISIPQLNIYAISIPQLNIYDVRFLMHFDGSDGSTIMIDQSGHIMTSLGSPAAISTSAPKFGTGSVLFSSVGDYIEGTCNSPDLFGQFWTVEAWVKPVSASINHGWLEYLSNNSLFALGVGDTAFMVIGNGPGSLELSMGAYSAGVWSHRAIVRNGSTVTTYADGVAQDSGSVGTDLLFDGGVNKFIRIGNNTSYSANGAFGGNIDEFRVVNGVAVYTGNFTPPSSPFPNP